MDMDMDMDMNKNEMIDKFVDAFGPKQILIVIASTIAGGSTACLAACLYLYGK